MFALTCLRLLSLALFRFWPTTGGVLYSLARYYAKRFFNIPSPCWNHGLSGGVEWFCPRIASTSAQTWWVCPFGRWCWCSSPSIYTHLMMMPFWLRCDCANTMEWRDRDLNEFVIADDWVVVVVVASSDADGARDGSFYLRFARFISLA